MRNIKSPQLFVFNFSATLNPCDFLFWNFVLLILRDNSSPRLFVLKFCRTFNPCDFISTKKFPKHCATLRLFAPNLYSNAMRVIFSSFWLLSIEWLGGHPLEGGIMFSDNPGQKGERGSENLDFSHISFMDAPLSYDLTLWTEEEHPESLNDTL